jgi:hypothetical protein
LIYLEYFPLHTIKEQEELNPKQTPKNGKIKEILSKKK